MRLETVTRIKGLLALALPLLWIAGLKTGLFIPLGIPTLFSLPFVLLLSFVFTIGWMRGRWQIRKTEHAARVMASAR